MKPISALKWSIPVFLCSLCLAASGAEHQCLPLRETIKNALLSERLASMQKNGLIKGLDEQDSPGWYHIPGQSIVEYSRNVSADTLEVIIDESHSAIRVGENVYHMLGNGIAIENFAEWIQLTQKKGHRAIGLVMQANQQELDAVKQYFEKAQNGATYSKFRNNCSQNTCRALQAANVHAPKNTFHALFPALTGLGISQNPRLKYKVSYHLPSVDSPSHFLNSAWQREVTPQIAVMAFGPGMVGLAALLVAGPSYLSKKHDEEQEQRANQALGRSIESYDNPDKLMSDLHTLASRQAQKARSDKPFRDSLLAYFEKNNDVFGPYLLGIGTNSAGLRKDFSWVLNVYGEQLLLSSYSLSVSSNTANRRSSLRSVLADSGIPIAK